MKKESKEELQKKLNAIEEQEHKEMIAKHYPEFKKLEGKFFKKRNNFSLPKKASDYWWYYTKVTEIKPEDVYDTGGNGVTSHFKGIVFQTDKFGNISIENEQSYIHSLGEEITEKEFMAAWNKLRNKIDSLI